MTSDAAVLAVLDAMEAAQIPYMFVGSIASNFHGVPRSTRDADFVVELSTGSIERLRNALPPELAVGSQPGFEPVTGSTRYVIELSGRPFVCELFVLSDDPHDVERFRRRLRVTIFGRPAWVATVEDSIVTKLRWVLGAHRAKDRDDIRNMLAVQSSAIDWTYIEHWTAMHGTGVILEEILRSLPQL